MRLCTEDMAKIGQLLLQRGKWNGRQLVSAQWVDTMTSNLVPSIPLNAFTSRMDPECFIIPVMTTVKDMVIMSGGEIMIHIALKVSGASIS